MNIKMAGLLKEQDWRRDFCVCAHCSTLKFYPLLTEFTYIETIGHHAKQNKYYLNEPQKGAENMHMGQGPPS